MAHKRCWGAFEVSHHWLIAFFTLCCFAVSQVAAQTVGGNGYLINPQQPILLPPGFSDTDNQEIDLRLQHIFYHGTHRHPDVFQQYNIEASARVWLEGDDGRPEQRSLHEKFPVTTKPLLIQRLSDRRPERLEKLLSAGRQAGKPLSLPLSAWTTDNIPGPNITDKKTVISLARMCNNAYVEEPGTEEWEDMDSRFNNTLPFGWDSDGLQGHVFSNKDNSTVVIAFKGTTLAVFDGAGTTTNDKVNDNLLFSCCCGQGGSILWRQVCDCQTATYTCNNTCLITNLLQKDRYYFAAQQLYHNVTALYPTSNIWLVGHSLGGSLSALVGLTYGLPAVSFEAPGDAMPAHRIGLPTPPGYHIGADGRQAVAGIFHFGHTGDPVYMGTCSSCTIAGYALESACHTGMECRYDTVKDKGFHSFIGNHKISSVIHDVLEVYDEPAKCIVVDDCPDCFNWKYFDGNASDPITSRPSSSSTSTSYTRTRTETCKTPGWWGCLDETTATTKTKTSTSSKSTSTCKTPGWFWCLDETTTTSSTTTSSTRTVPTTTTSCRTPGWFGCNDPVSTTTIAKPSKTATLPTETKPPNLHPSDEPKKPPKKRRSLLCRWFGLGCKRRKSHQLS